MTLVRLLRDAGARVSAGAYVGGRTEVEILLPAVADEPEPEQPGDRDAAVRARAAAALRTARRPQG